MVNFTVENNRGIENYWLDVPFPLKDRAKKLFRSIRWNPSRRQWYCPVNAANTNILMNDREPKVFPLAEEKGWNLENVNIVKTELPPRYYDLPVKAFPPQMDYHQVLMAYDSLRFRQRIIAGEMRTGKTLSDLEALATLKNRPLEVLWLAPISGCVSVRQEIKKWNIDLNKVVLTLKNYEKLTHVYDPHLHYTHSSLAFDVIICDEGHRLKSPDSKRGKLARTFYETMQKKAHELRGDETDFYLWILTGTPAPKDPTDLHNLIEITHPGFLPWGSKELMLQDLAVTKTTDYNGFPVVEVDTWKLDMVDQFYEDYVSQVMTTVLKAEVLDIPEKQIKLHKLQPTMEMKGALQFVRRTCEDQNQLLRKVAQVSDGFLYRKDEETLSTETNPKMVKVLEFLDLARDDGRLCILAGYTESVDKIVTTCIEQNWNVLRIDGRGYKLFHANGKAPCNWTTDEALAQMDNSRNPNRSIPLVVVGHPKSVATGLELSATKDLIYYSTVTDGEAMLQSIERPHSRNMRDRLTIHFLFNLYTDEYLYEQMKLKKQLMNITMTGLTKAIDKDLNGGEE